MHALQPVPVDGWDVVAVLWPLNKDFRPNLEKFKALDYDSRFEPQADAAIDRYLQTGEWGLVSVETWRVLLERHCQAIMVATLNAAQGNPLMSVPASLPHDALKGAAMLWLLYGMKLPFPTEDRSAHAIPAVPPRGR